MISIYAIMMLAGDVCLLNGFVVLPVRLCFIWVDGSLFVQDVSRFLLFCDRYQSELPGLWFYRLLGYELKKKF